MGSTPGTGQTIAIGRTWTAFKTGRTYPPSAGQNVSLRGTLGIEVTGSYKPSGSLTFATQIVAPSTASLSNFWNLGTPNNYP